MRGCRARAAIDIVTGEEQGEERREQRTRRGDILMVGEERLGAADESVRDQLVARDSRHAVIRGASQPRHRSGFCMLEESDTYLMILEQGEDRERRDDILVLGEVKFGTADPSIREEIAKVTDRERLIRMIRKAATAATWQENFDTP
jgi:hypothetical protein